MRMTSVIALCSALTGAVILSSASPVAAVETVDKRKYKNCRDLTRVYPNGVAIDQFIAAKLTTHGFALPAANEKLFLRLADPIGPIKPKMKWNGLPPSTSSAPLSLALCLRQVPLSPPSPVRNAWGDYEFNGSMTLYWGAPENRGGSGVTYLIRAIDATNLFYSSTSYFRRTTVFGIKSQQLYTFEIIAVNASGQSEPVLVTVNTGEVPRPPAALDAIPYYPICFSAEQAGVAPIYELLNPDLYDKNKHLDGDGDGIACEPYAWD